MVNNNLHTHLAITRYIIGGNWRWHGANYELLNALNPLTTASPVNDITNGAYSRVLLGVRMRRGGAKQRTFIVTAY